MCPLPAIVAIYSRLFLLAPGVCCVLLLLLVLAWFSRVSLPPAIACCLLLVNAARCFALFLLTTAISCCVFPFLDTRVGVLLLLHAFVFCVFPTAYFWSLLQLLAGLYPDLLCVTPPFIVLFGAACPCFMSPLVFVCYRRLVLYTASASCSLATTFCWCSPLLLLVSAVTCSCLFLPPVATRCHHL